ncbi:unnamed protein product [Peronospora belbahrii]|uniref:Uncharacterized protein n=1 Tax=Peronospora belbahrii TaxID=622444 RepID=A0ABN8D3G6_9STRA|nr:unnamed protein product [Peronospora belbahrii]
MWYTEAVRMTDIMLKQPLPEITKVPVTMNLLKRRASSALSLTRTMPHQERRRVRTPGVDDRDIRASEKTEELHPRRGHKNAHG